MKTLLKIASVVALLLSVFTMSGQNLEAFRYSIETADTLTNASIRITEHGTAADVINYQGQKPKTVRGYRIRIFFANDQNARQQAVTVQNSFRSQFPTIPSYLVYENPAFIVTVGNCATMEEALILQNRLKSRFKTAFIWHGEIPIAEFLRTGDINPEAQTPQDETQSEDSLQNGEMNDQEGTTAI